MLIQLNAGRQNILATTNTGHKIKILKLDQLANLHFHFTSVPRCTPMTDKHMFYSVLWRSAYSYCKLVFIVKFGLYLEIYVMRLVNLNNT